MAPGTWAELSTNNINQTLGNTGGSSRTVITYLDSLPWDPTSLSLWFIAGDHNQNTAVNPNKFFRYNATTNTWQGLGTPSFVAHIQSHGYDHSAIDPATGDVYHRAWGSNNRRVNRYIQSTGTWSSLPPVPFGDYIETSIGTAYFPKLKGYIIANGAGGSGFLYLFNTVTQQWEKLASNLTMGNYGNFAEYNPVHKVVVFGGGQGRRVMWKVDSSKQVTRLKDAPVALGVQTALFTVDPVSGDYLVLNGSRAFYKYNVLTDTWTLLNGAAAPIWTTAYANSVNGMAAASIPTYGVNFFVSCDYSTCRVNLYKHSRGPPRGAFASTTSLVSHCAGGVFAITKIATSTHTGAGSTCFDFFASVSEPSSRPLSDLALWRWE